MRVARSALAGLVIVALQGCVRHVAVPDAHALGPGEEIPPGMVLVDVVSNDDRQDWDVYVGENVVCTTPCRQWFHPRDALFLEAPNGDAVFVPTVGDPAQAQRVMLVAEGTNRAKKVNGIVFTTFGGMGLVTAITFTAVGCSDIQERAGICNAGLITGMVSLPVTAFALWMLIDSGPRSHLLPMVTTRATNGHPPATIAFGPTGVAGTF